MTDPWTWGVTQDLLYYLLLDPTARRATDPRPSFPTLFYDAPAGRIVAHSDWTPNGTMFDYRASWISINHQDGDGGQFELFRKGEWLTKEMSNYDNGGGGNGATPSTTTRWRCRTGAPPAQASTSRARRAACGPTAASGWKAKTRATPRP